MSNICTYHNNTDIGLTTWNPVDRSYYLIPFANVASYFRQLNEKISVAPALVDNAFEFLSVYNPENEAVLLTLNEDLLTVAIIKKDQKPSAEAVAEQLGWCLNKLIAFQYLWEINPDCNFLCKVFGLTGEEYDHAISALLQ